MEITAAGDGLCRESVMITGYSKLPENALLHSRYGGNFSVILELNRKTGEIVNLDCATNSEIQIAYLNHLLVGESLRTDEGMQRISMLLERNFNCSLRKPIYSGILACKQRFEELVTKYPG